MNIIDAIINIVKKPRLNLKEIKNGENRANNMGEALEEYIADLFADSFELLGEKKYERRSAVFSYSGNTNHPPDLMLKDGDAIEVKKIQNPKSVLALNSSYPKHKLLASSSMICNSCKNAEKDWTEKDIIYAVGVTKSDKLHRLCFIYGTEYAAPEEFYLKIGDIIRKGVKKIPSIELAKTSELGRINRVDPLGITYLRVRGMWGIKNPWCVFSSHHIPNSSFAFDFMSIIRKEKYDSFLNTVELEALAQENNNLTIRDIHVRNPGNPVNLINAKLIHFFVK